MKAVIAIDSFKGSLSTWEAGNAIKEGILKIYPNAETVISPLADGGEGTAEVIVSATKGAMRTIAAHDPLGRKIMASYGITGKTAVIEMASASGITLISEKERDPLRTTTFGVGELIADAIRYGCREFIIGLGGSATNDGGIGMLSALGFEFLNQNGDQILFGAKGLKELSEIRTENRLPLLSECHFSVACDVKNSLCGKNGCSAVFALQKGGTKETIPLMDAWLSHYAKLTRTVNPNADENTEGCGAAGGLGFAFLSYLNAELRSGIELVMQATGLKEQIKAADIVITGEGRLDGSSCMGKAPSGVAKLAKTYGKPVIALAGCVTEEASALHQYGIDAFFPIIPSPCTLADAMDKTRAYRNLSRTTEQIFRLWRTAQGEQWGGAF
ncbi:MAG: glycerate kinase [Clostridia bacterium]|nr:glycerate kinase [Clostridia bacterium]